MKKAMKVVKCCNVGEKVIRYELKSNGKPKEETIETIGRNCEIHGKQEIKI